MNNRKQLYLDWIAALRSGHYKQGVGQLMTPSDTSDGPLFCCLGVACDLQLKQSGETWTVTVVNSRGFYQGYDKNMPRSLVRDFGLTNLELNRLTRINDVDKLSFDQIANHIKHEIMPNKCDQLT